MNRLIQRLDQAIQQALIPRELPFLRAERAVVWARMGLIERARAEAASLRRRPDLAGTPALGAWILLIEGLADYYEDCSSSRSRDRVLKAMALARTAKAPRLLALAAAWCAHLDFRQQQDEACLEHLRLALRTAAPEDLAARARAAIVLAGLYQFCGREDLARRWYTAARAHANRDGDAVTLSSIMYNMAALQVLAVRLADLFGEADQGAARRAILAIESSVALDRSVQSMALSHHPPMQRAMVLVAHERHADALALYEQAMGEAMVEGLSGSECLFHADRAWCLWRLGRSDEALAAARVGESALVWGTEAEERAIAHGMLARVLAPLGLPDQARRHAALAQEECARHRRRCEALLSAAQGIDGEALEPLLGPVPAT